MLTAVQEKMDLMQFVKALEAIARLNKFLPAEDRMIVMDTLKYAGSSFLR